LLANYDYGPFGEVIRATGPARGTNPLRFSTKYQDDESDLLYYGRRYYKPSTGTWLSRDIIEDKDNQNLYLYANNDGVNEADFLGMATLEFKVVVGTINLNIGGLFHSNSGKWSQPAIAGDGSYEIGGTYAKSSVALQNQEYWPFASANFCNTVDWEDPDANYGGYFGFGDAGSILVFAREDWGCGGLFKVSFNYSAAIIGRGPGHKSSKHGAAGDGGMAILYDVHGHILSEIETTTANPIVYDARPFSFKVHLNAHERKRVIFQDVILNLPDPKGQPVSVEAEAGEISDVVIQRDMSGTYY